MLKIWWIWKIEVWSENLVDGHQTVPYQAGALFWGLNCLVGFPTHFNPNNSLSILLQISPPFMFTPALSMLLTYLSLHNGIFFGGGGERKLDRLLTGIWFYPFFSWVSHHLGELIYPQQQLTFCHVLFLVYCNFDVQSLCQFTQGTGDQYDWLLNKGTTSSSPDTGPSADISSTGQQLEASLAQPI